MFYILKLVISFLVEFFIAVLFIPNVILNITLNFLNSLSRKSDFELLMFKSGTMGDHLICIDSINNFRINKRIKNSSIICREKSIFFDIFLFSKENNVNLVSYKKFFKQFVKLFFSNNIFIIIDTEPNFRIGLLISMFFPRAVVITNKKNIFDEFYAKLNSLIEFQIYDENVQEGIYISKLLNNSVEILNRKYLNLKLKKINLKSFIKTFNKQNINFLRKDSLQFHNNSIGVRKNKNRKIIYLYYGCSGKALHRLPSIKWMREFNKLLLKRYFIFYIGGPSERTLEDMLSLNQNTNLSFDFINKFSISEWSSILTNSEYKIPLIAFDGGFSHIYGFHAETIFQVFCSTNGKKWKNKSPNSGIYSCINGGSPNYKPYKFLVPDKCKISEESWLHNSPSQVYDHFNEWIRRINY